MAWEEGGGSEVAGEEGVYEREGEGRELRVDVIPPTAELACGWELCSGSAIQDELELEETSVCSTGSPDEAGVLALAVWSCGAKACACLRG